MYKKSAAISIIIVMMLTLPLLASSSLQPALAIPGVRAPSTVTCPPTCYYYNWAGYAVAGPTGSVSEVIGSWTVPTFTGPTCNANEEWVSSIWIGIDGFTSSTVEQTGTSTGCNEGTAFYLAWYEFYPALSVTIPHSIFPGDSMSAEVKYASSEFTLSISDTTTAHAWSFSTTGKVSGAKRSSAEWIAESPTYLIGLVPLADFGTVYFTSDTAVTTFGSGTIGSFPSADIATITSVCWPSGAPAKATPSSLTNSGANFDVVWDNPGPEG